MGRSGPGLGRAEALPASLLVSRRIATDVGVTSASDPCAAAQEGSSGLVLVGAGFTLLSRPQLTLSEGQREARDRGRPGAAPARALQALQQEQSVVPVRRKPQRLPSFVPSAGHSLTPRLVGKHQVFVLQQSVPM